MDFFVLNFFLLVFFNFALVRFYYAVAIYVYLPPFFIGSLGTKKDFKDKWKTWVKFKYWQKNQLTYCFILYGHSCLFDIYSWFPLFYSCSSSCWQPSGEDTITFMSSSLSSSLPSFMDHGKTSQQLCNSFCIFLIIIISIFFIHFLLVWIINLWTF